MNGVAAVRLLPAPPQPQAGDRVLELPPDLAWRGCVAICSNQPDVVCGYVLAGWR
jgi:hypothetical protein